MGSEEKSTHANAKHGLTKKEGNEADSPKGKGRPSEKDAASAKRRCVSTACIACRKRKSKCDGNLPSCAACASVYYTECIYDPNSDHRRKGVYKKDIDTLKTRNTTLHTLIQSILNSSEVEAFELVKQIRSSDNLDKIAEGITAGGRLETPEQQELHESDAESDLKNGIPQFEKELASKMGGLRLENDTFQFIGGTSNLLHDESIGTASESLSHMTASHQYAHQEDAIRSWTTVTGDIELILHLLNMYFTWHYTYFTVLSKHLFFQDFYRGKPPYGRQSNEHCTSLLVNAILAVGCHFSSWKAAYANALDPTTAGDHFFKEAKRLFIENDEYESPRLPTVQALAIMSAREAGCARETKGWVYSGMSFRMACDLGLNVRMDNSNLSEHEIDARRITFWGCFLFDKCWSNYLGRPPQLPLTNITAPKFDVFPTEDAEVWSPWTDTGLDRSIAHPSRTRAVALKISEISEISNDIIFAFYCVQAQDRKMSKPGQIKQLGELHRRLETWRQQIPAELEPSEGQLPHVLTMHMFFQLLYIHLFRPFLKYAQPGGPLPANANPKRICIQSATMISKLLRMYKRTYGLKQICNVVVYIAHAACTIHLLNLPDKDALRDVVHTIHGLEDIAEHWLCARKALLILGVQVRKWNIKLPEEATVILRQANQSYSRSFSSQANTEVSLAQPLSPISAAAAAMSQPFTQHNASISQQNPLPAATRNVKGSANSIGSSFHKHKPNQPQLHLNHELTSPASKSLLTEDATTSSHSMPTASYIELEDTKDWWLKDQSSLLDQWTDTEPHPVGSLMSSDSTAGGVWDDAAMIGLSGGRPLAPNKSEGVQDGFGVQHHDYGLDYLDFPSGSMYPFHGNSGGC